MNSYILQRNNVESKPMSLEELAKQGLRPTDLVWVECQSWDWQRASEIPELKKLLEGDLAALGQSVTNTTPTADLPGLYASNPEKAKEKLKVRSSVLPTGITNEPILPIKKEPPQPVAKTKTADPVEKVKKPIHIRATVLPDEEVTGLKSQESTISNASPVTTKEQVPAVKQVVEMPVAKQEYVPPATTSLQKPKTPVVPSPDKIYASEEIDETMYKYAGITPPAAEKKQEDEEQKAEQTEPELTTHYTRALDEIKEMYVRNLEEQKRKRENRFFFKWPAHYKRVAVYVIVAATGALVMLFASNTGKKKGNLTAVSPRTAKEIIQQPSAVNEESTKQPDPVIPADEITGEVLVTSQQTAADDAVTAQQKKEVRSEKAVTENIPPVEAEEKNEEMKEAAAEPQPRIKKTGPASGLASQLRLSTNDYTTGSFGGIRNLELTLRNESEFLLDEVIVELKYLNLDNIAVNTERIIFRSVAAGEPETVAVKKSRRGMKVKYRVINVESKEADNSTASH